ncbi:MAG: hypothetical protein ABSF65_01450 [Candidatus Bathyarchaeia archaeon]|jgi:hypothetical protein
MVNAGMLITSIDDDRVQKIGLRVQTKNGVTKGDIAPGKLDDLEAKIAKGLTEEEFAQWCEKQWPANLTRGIPNYYSQLNNYSKVEG